MSVALIVHVACLSLGCLGSMLARSQRSATMNPPGVAGHAGGIRGPGLLRLCRLFLGALPERVRVRVESGGPASKMSRVTERSER